MLFQNDIEYHESSNEISNYNKYWILSLEIKMFGITMINIIFVFGLEVKFIFFVVWFQIEFKCVKCVYLDPIPRAHLFGFGFNKSKTIPFKNYDAIKYIIVIVVGKIIAVKLFFFYRCNILGYEIGFFIYFFEQKQCLPIYLVFYNLKEFAENFHTQNWFGKSSVIGGIEICKNELK